MPTIPSNQENNETGSPFIKKGGSEILLELISQAKPSDTKEAHNIGMNSFHAMLATIISKGSPLKLKSPYDYLNGLRVAVKRFHERRENDLNTGLRSLISSFQIHTFQVKEPV